MPEEMIPGVLPEEDTMALQDVVMPDPPAPQEGYVNEMPEIADGVVVESPGETQETLQEYGISEEKLEEIRENVKREIDRADHYYQEEIEPEVIRRHKVYESDAKYYIRIRALGKNKSGKWSKKKSVWVKS